MSSSGDKPTRAGRTVTADEARLWEKMTRDLEPVVAKGRVAAAGKALSTAPASVRPREPVPPAPPTRKAAPAASRDVPVAPAKRRAAPPLADFERRKVRQIASGKIEVDARIDLHGARQRDARAQFRAFLLRAYAQGHRTVLVITGKGGDEPADGLGDLMGERQRGVLRRNVPHWLEDPELRAIVLSYTQASPRHGGAGALYVQLRRSERTDREG